MREINLEIEIEFKDIMVLVFDVLLKYVYLGKMFFGDYKEEIILELLSFVYKYGFLVLESVF